MEYVIETEDLVKRYPTSARRERGGFHSSAGRVTSFGGMLSIFRGTRGPFIEALRGVDLKIKRGEVFGILGPNGAGKTTLIKILCTLVIHDEGEAYVHGFNVKKEPANVLKNLQAVLPESRGFNWRLSGRQNLEFYALLYGLRTREAKERINYVLEFTGLKERADDGYQRYSTGMQRRLLVCRALLKNTPTLIFDEPTAGLDPASAEEFRSLLRDRLARKEGKTIFLSTHNLYEAQDMFDERVLNITFNGVVFNVEVEKMANELGEVSGVHGATPDVSSEGALFGISIRVDKDIDLSNILEVIMKNGLNIRGINVKEPTLEDAFIAITRKQDEKDR
jgi:ABC-2 type transport system ATP-binding protein